MSSFRPCRATYPSLLARPHQLLQHRERILTPTAIAGILGRHLCPGFARIGIKQEGQLLGHRLAHVDPAIGNRIGWVVRLGIQDRYDSDPGTSKKNDVTYFATLGLKF